MKHHCNCLQEDIVLQGKYIEKRYNINQYIELEDSNLPPLGSRVRRRPGWRYGDQDKGRSGTVVGHHKGNVLNSLNIVHLFKDSFNIQYY